MSVGYSSKNLSNNNCCTVRVVVFGLEKKLVCYKDTLFLFLL